jgi:hypothetical protein
MAVVAPEGGTRSAVRATAEELLPGTTEMGRGMADYISSGIPELAEFEDDEFRAELIASCEASIGQVLRMLRDGAPADDVRFQHEAMNFLRGNVRRGVPLAVLLRSYRLGHAWLWEQWSGVCGGASSVHGVSAHGCGLASEPLPDQGRDQGPHGRDQVRQA